ncbi:hypothetical protein BACCAP_03517 [Pseudoflavonifractor capillosus ATCC 29799]|uniref:Uncharacterized protein n=1 Tax=Pseudoflavonifractor capillosus ATCC 29799 TaxID=411467 RepID=A6NZ67_9FIRM|nr:hypothetical protein BACCAP_03517 [Pseudoflavonifractor capillosus ATCC 29799]
MVRSLLPPPAYPVFSPAVHQICLPFCQPELPSGTFYQNSCFQHTIYLPCAPFFSSACVFHQKHVY